MTVFAAVRPEGTSRPPQTSPVRRATRRWVLIGALLATVALLSGCDPASGKSSRPPSTPEHTTERPGPAVLYAAAPTEPQLQNHDPRFRAPFNEVSGTERYTGGEYQYTDYLYDDYGSDTTGSGGGGRAASAGHLTYPTDRARYADNAADLVEFRIAARPDGLAVRFALNTLLVSDATIATVAFDTDHNPSTGSATLPRDPGAPFPGTDAVLTTWGNGAEWSRWNGTGWATTKLTSRADLTANQITVTVPRTVAHPTGRWSATVAIGLYDPTTGGWLRPGAVATGTQPGGAGKADPHPSGIFNLGFRFDQQALRASSPPDTEQAEALAAHQPTRFAHDIDFTLLAHRATRDTTPATGTTIRFFPSRLQAGEGRAAAGTGIKAKLDGQPGIGPLQPYALYVPTGYRPGVPTPFTLDLHSLNQHYWQYDGSTGVQQIGEQRGSIVLTPEARGGGGWYVGPSEYDVFEAWNAVAARYDLDSHRTSIAGYSMGGYGTYRIGGLYPDLFARAVAEVGPPGAGIWHPGLHPIGGAGGYETLSNNWLENNRNLPYLNVAATNDQLVPLAGAVQQNTGQATSSGLQSFDELGYRFDFLEFPGADHFTLAGKGYDLPAARDFLGNATVDTNPFHVTYAYVPGTDDRALGLVHDKAYWVSGIQVANPSAGRPSPKGVVDVKSLAFGLDDPTSTRATGQGTAPLPYSEVARTWGAPRQIARRNEAVIDLHNVSAVRIDTTRARLVGHGTITLDVSSTDAAVVTLTGSHGAITTVRVAAGHHTYRVDPVGG